MRDEKERVRVEMERDWMERRGNERDGERQAERKRIFVKVPPL